MERIAAGAGVLSQLLSTAPVQFLGRISYSVYMIHGLVISAIGGASRVLERLLHQSFHATGGEVFGPTAPADTLNWPIISFGNLWLNDAYGLFYLAVLIGLSALTYHYIERPGQRLFARLAAPRPATTGKAAIA